MTKRTDGPSAAVRIRVMKRDRFQCTYCGAPGTDVELEVDHIISVARGGSHHMSNLTTACRDCNQAKGAGEPPKRAAKTAGARQLPADPNLLLQAEIVRVIYHARRGVLELHLADGDCVDMAGAVELARRIDPAIDRIHTFSGEARDTSYSFEGVDWVAFAGPMRVVS
jgi:5-methylcytosine-specific restriction protein A